MSLFELYQGEPGTVRAAGADGAGSARRFSTVREGLQDGRKKAAGAVVLSLDAPVQSAVSRPTGEAADLTRAGYLVKGVCHMFAGAIREYNTGVRQLNQTYEEARANDFGVIATQGATMCYATPEDVPPGENAQAIADARDALVAELRKSERSLRRELNQVGDEAATMLDKGPMDPETIVRLATFGGLPAGAMNAWPAPLVKDAKVAVKFALRLKKLMGGPAALKKMREMYKAAGNASDAARRLADATKDWDAIFDTIANGTIDPKSSAALGAWLRGQADMADLKEVRDAANAALGAARDDLLKQLKLASKGGKALGVLGVALSVYDAYTLAKQWDELSTTKKVTRSIEVGAGLAGSAATIAILAGASGPAAPAVLAVAGIIGGAAAIYNNWDTISEYAGKAKDAIVDEFNRQKELISTGLDVAGGYMKEGLEEVGGFLEDRGEDIIRGAATVKDFGEDRLDDIRGGLGKAAGAAESIAPWNW